MHDSIETQPGGVLGREAARLPLTWEHTVGASRALVAGLELDLDLVYSKAAGLPVTDAPTRYVD